MFSKELVRPSEPKTIDIDEKFRIHEQRIKRPVKKAIGARISSQISAIYKKDMKNAKLRQRRAEEKLLLLAPDLPFPNKPEGKLECHCNICIFQNKIKPELPEIPCDEFFKGFNFNESPKTIGDPERDFVFLLKRLIPPRHASQSMRLLIPDTLVFSGGQPLMIVRTGQDKTVKFIKDKEKLALGEIKKFFQERFAEAEEQEKGSEEHNKQETDSMSLFTKDDVSKTERTQGTDARRRGQSEYSLSVDLKEMDLKRAVHKRHRLKKIHTGKEVALVKFYDELEFDTLLERKKFDPYWKRICYIQNYSAFAKNLHSLQRVYFVLDRETQHPLFDRASKESQQFHGDILQVSEDYIPVHEEEKFEQELMHSDQNTYCCYLLMKIYHFMETIQGFRILRMGADFVKDRNGAIWLVNICRLQFQSLPNKGKNAIQTRGMSLLGLDVVQRIPEELPDITEDPERKEEVDFLLNMMKSKYEEAKIAYGLAKPPRIDCEDDISNNIFSILYPEIPVKLSTILEISTKHEDLFPIVEKFVRKANHFRNPGKTPQDVNITIEEDRNKQKTFRGNKNINKSKSKENLSPFPGKRIRKRVNFFAPQGGPEQTLPSLEPFETSKEENKSPLLSQPTSPDIKTRSKSQPVLRKIVRNENWSQLSSPLKKIAGYVPAEPYYRRKKSTSRLNSQIYYNVEYNMLEGIPKSARYSTNERSTSSPKLSLPNSARLDHFGKRVRDLIALRIAQNPIKKQIIKMGENSLPSLLRKPKEGDLNYSFSFCD